MNSCFMETWKKIFKNGFKKLVHHWDKFNQINVDYFKKDSNIDEN